MENQKKTKIIYSMQMMKFLLQHGLQFIEIIQHPFKKNFKAWTFEDTEELRQLMKKFTEGE